MFVFLNYEEGYKLVALHPMSYFSKRQIGQGVITLQRVDIAGNNSGRFRLHQNIVLTQYAHEIVLTQRAHEIVLTQSACKKINSPRRVSPVWPQIHLRIEFFQV
jgi:hypothetical protein